MKTSTVVIAMILAMTSISAYAIPIETNTNMSMGVMDFPAKADCVAGACFGGDLKQLAIAASGLAAPQPIMRHYVPPVITPIERGTTLLMAEMSMVLVKCQHSESGLPCDSGEGTTSVPEPGTLWLLGSGLLLLGLRRRKQPTATA